MHALDQFNVYPKPFVYQPLHVEILLICKPGHKVIYIWVKVNRKAEDGVRIVEFATFARGGLQLAAMSLPEGWPM